MAVAYDAVSTAGFNFTGTYSWTHTPVGTPRGAMVWPWSPGGDNVTGVTYGGSAMAEVTGSPLQKNTGEAITVYGYFLGASVPSGAQTVEVTQGGTDTRNAMAITMTAEADTEIVDTSTISSDSQADPSVVLSLGGRECFCAIKFGSGHNAITDVTPNSGWTGRAEGSNGSYTNGLYTYDTVGTTDVTAGWTQTAEDAVAIAAAFAEVAGGGDPIRIRFHPQWSGMGSGGMLGGNRTN